MTITLNDNLILERIAPYHAPALFSAVNSNRTHLSTFLPWVPHMQSVADFEKYIANVEELYQQKQEVSFVILHQQQLVGRIGVHYINHQHLCGAIGYWLIKEAEGKGIISMATTAIINYAFEQLQLHRLEIKAATTNYRSLAVPKRLGFTHEGVLRQAEKINNHFLDLSLFSLLKHEWIKHST
ncbi:MAG: hypothetical protein RIR12_877 [Bacteroidota bacterium]